MPGLSLGRAYLQDWLDTFDDFKGEPVDLIDAGEDKVIGVTRISGRPKLSGVETDLTYRLRGAPRRTSRLRDQGGSFPCGNRREGRG